MYGKVEGGRSFKARVLDEQDEEKDYGYIQFDSKVFVIMLPRRSLFHVYGVLVYRM